MATPPFILALRELIGTHPLWLPCVTAVVVRGEKVLLIRRADTGEWASVAGIIDPAEQPAHAAEREVLEEAGIVAKADRIAGLDVTDPVTYSNGDRSQYLNVVVRLDWVAGEPYPADGEATHAVWAAVDDIEGAPFDLSIASRRWITWALSDSERANFS